MHEGSLALSVGKRKGAMVVRSYICKKLERKELGSVWMKQNEIKIFILYMFTSCLDEIHNYF